MLRSSISAWKSVPFLRILIPFCIGIVLQRYLDFSITLVITIGATGFTLIFLPKFFPFLSRSVSSFLRGVGVNGLFLFIGLTITDLHNTHKKQSWFANNISDNSSLIVAVDEPLQLRANSYRTIASIAYTTNGKSAIKATGKLILYFQKDSSVLNLSPGSMICFNNTPVLIPINGNPGGFNYRDYAALQGITHQVYLTSADYQLLRERKQSWIRDILNTIRTHVLQALRNNIRSKEELGLAEALLIGYKDDLDKTLVQSYANTGVVHIIAISGLHLGLIYLLLVRLLKPLRRKETRLLIPIIIICSLWLFTLLAGGQPSVLRSAVMFTCIVLGETMQRKKSTYNTLALSAFLLLCYNPLWLWDLGFQLSYSAILSLLLFMKPIYHSLTFKNKIVDLAWQANAVTLAAQILTTPISILYFHQFPIYFLLTNFVAVPLSSLILLGEIALYCVSAIDSIAAPLGHCLVWLLHLMNSYVVYMGKLPFALWTNLQISNAQAVMMYGIIITSFLFSLRLRAMYLKLSLSFLFCFLIERTLSFKRALHQHLLIVYNVPKLYAISIIQSRTHQLIGDSMITHDSTGAARLIEPAKTLYRANTDLSKPVTQIQNVSFNIGSQRMLILTRSLLPTAKYPGASQNITRQNPIAVDVVILAGRFKTSPRDLLQLVTPRAIVASSGFASLLAASWKEECKKLNIPFHSTTESGAFIMNVQSLKMPL
jgi:competence protein ComEC